MEQAIEAERVGRRKGSGVRIVVLSLLAFLFVLMLVAMAWWHSTNITPAVRVPTPEMPSPNAFGTFGEAAGALVQAADVGNALYSESAPRAAAGANSPGAVPADNAPPGNVPGTAAGAAAGSRTYSLAEQEALVRKNAEALRKLREGLRHPYMEPPARSFTHMYPHYPGFRSLARLLRLEGQVKSARGDWPGSLRSGLDAVEMGVKIPRGGPVLGELVGVAVQAIGRREAWEAIDHLSAGEAAAGARRMERILAEQVPFADTLQEEKWTTQAGLLEVFRKPDWRREMVRSTVGGAPPGSPPSAEELSMRGKLLLTSKSAILKSYTAYADRVIAAVRRPYASRAPLPPVPRDVVSATLAPVVDHAHFAAVKAEAYNALLTTALALRAYRAEHGRHPASLADLAPRYLKQVPVDPFAAKGSLRYRGSGDRFVLYSIGPDAVDDGGQPVLNPARGGTGSRARYFLVELASKGDIVVGKNVQ